MQNFSNFDLKELKLVYRILHQNLMNHLDLMDSDFMGTLQSWLQYRASEDGVDLSDHSQWDAWLKNQAPPPQKTISLQQIGSRPSGKDSD